nr:MAG TPA: hypothetical protein [Caudoviricetes sp.]
MNPANMVMALKVCLAEMLTISASALSSSS